MLGLCGRDSRFCPWSLCSSSPKNSISEQYELLILLQQPACLTPIPDFVETHNYTKGELIGPKEKNIQALSPISISALTPPTPFFFLHTRPERLMGRDFNAYVMSPISCDISRPMATPLRPDIPAGCRVIKRIEKDNNTIRNVHVEFFTHYKKYPKFFLR